MFLGTHAPRLDDKGRLILPAKFRDQLAQGVVVTRGQERCLYVFPAAEFARMHEQLRQAPATSKQARDYMRVFLSGASDELPDKQGRITIPAQLRTYADLDRDVTVIGAGSRVEIWDAPAWETYLAEQENVFARPPRRWSPACSDHRPHPRATSTTARRPSDPVSSRPPVLTHLPRCQGARTEGDQAGRAPPGPRRTRPGDDCDPPSPTRALPHFPRAVDPGQPPGPRRTRTT